MRVSLSIPPPQHGGSAEAHVAPGRSIPPPHDAPPPHIVFTSSPSVRPTPASPTFSANLWKVHRSGPFAHNCIVSPPQRYRVATRASTLSQRRQRYRAAGRRTPGAGKGARVVRSVDMRTCAAGCPCLHASGSGLRYGSEPSPTVCVCDIEFWSAKEGHLPSARVPDVLRGRASRRLRLALGFIDPCALGGSAGPPSLVPRSFARPRGTPRSFPALALSVGCL